MDRLEGMSILVAVVDAGSLSAASRQLDLPLATVSRKLCELEAVLKTRLVHRTTRHLSLTDSGESYVASCRPILEDIGELERAVTGEYATPKGFRRLLFIARVGVCRRRCAALVITAPVVFGQTVPVHARLVTTTAESAIDAVTLGTGLTRALSYRVEDALHDGRLQLVLEEYALPPLPIQLVHLGQMPVPLKLRALLDFMSPRLKDRLGAA